MANRKKDTDYFAYFRKSAEFASSAAAYLDDTLKNFDPATSQARFDEMHKIEHEADANRHEMIEQLAKEFIPPIEREDIVALAHELDNVVDTIDEFVQFMYMYNVGTIREDALAFSALIIRCCDALLAAVTEFRSFRKSKTLKEMLIKVNTLESEGDVLHAESVRKLFLEDADAKTTLVWTKLFDALESCLDACEDAVDIIESVVMKNS